MDKGKCYTKCDKSFDKLIFEKLKADFSIQAKN